MTTIPVNGPAPYEVRIGSGLTAEIADAAGAAANVCVIHQGSVAPAANRIVEALSARGVAAFALEIEDAEEGKTLESAGRCWDVLGERGLGRTDAIVAVGGGAATDLGGYVAAAWMRGIKVYQVPTTLLAMVDAAVGGKTGINTAEGKNLVGAFWAPSAVVCDLDLLATLSSNEAVAGFAEVVKAGFIWYPEILDLIETDHEAAVDPSTDAFRRCIELAISMKAHVVGEDFREGGLREVLNYGHTLGHAIEHAERYRWRHGAAISVGMMYAAELSRLAGRLPDAAAQRHRDVLELLGLPTSYRAGAWPQLLATMQRDKKARAGMLRFIVLDDIAKPRVLAGVEESVLQFAYQEIAQ